MEANVSKEIKNVVKKAIVATGYATPKEVSVEHPQNADFGDFATAVAMALAKSEQSGAPAKAGKRGPKEIAEEIAKHIPIGKESDLIESVNVVGGFINISLKKSWLVEQLAEVLAQKDSYGTQSKKSTKKDKVMIEYGQPNTHKIPHIAHLYSYTFGESASRLLEASGSEVFRANYQGDIGPHVAKCLWAYMKNKPSEPETLYEKAQLLQKMYQQGAAAYKDDDEAKAEIDKLNVDIYAKAKEVFPIWEKTREWSVDYYKAFETRLGTKYDRHYFESEMYEPGAKIVKENVGKVFEKSEGAIVFRGEDYGLHTRVFLTSKGTAPYEAKDMALQLAKYKEWPFDKLIITTASEQNEYFKVVIKALELVEPAFEGKLQHVGFGMIQLKSGKMSSRTGNILAGDELINMAVEAIKKIVDKREGLSAKEKGEIAEKVGVGAVKWSFLKGNPLQDSVFDFKESVSFEGNSGPYMQYTYARAMAVLREADTDPKKVKDDFDLEKALGSDEEMALVRTIYKYPEAVEKAAKDLAPNDVCTYLYDLAQKFGTFYNKHRIVQAKSKDAKNSRLLLTAATAQVIKNGLHLLGIDVLEKM